MVPPLKDDETWTERLHRDSSPTATHEKFNLMVEAGAAERATAFPQVKFSHIHIYVDCLDHLHDYKKQENDLCDFAAALILEENKYIDKSGKRQLWQSIASGEQFLEYEIPEFVPQNRDVIKQLMAGFGMRVTGLHHGCGTKSFLVTTKDLGGVQIVVTAKDPSSNVPWNDGKREYYQHFDQGNIDRFYQNQNGKQGIAVLGFHVDNVEAVYLRYQQLHPNLIHYHGTYGSTSILEVYAYYQHDWDHTEVNSSNKKPDVGTLLRFVETRDGFGSVAFCVLPGLEQVHAEFDDESRPAYFDHWVSNVFSRTEFLSTLHDTLGFESKVDFNAGVVAAGEAQIESTVTGNESTLVTADKDIVLQDQSQVYLPINNALSPVGHVHGFLDEIGQGVQHIANRVENLVEFVSHCNEFREITGEGFTFLQIPRSYYGVLSSKYLADKANISTELAEIVVNICFDTNIASLDGAVDLEISSDVVFKALDKELMETPFKELYLEARERVVEAILASRYSNLYNLLRNHVSESTYLDLVKNKILCDVQGQDVLYQIFTCKILLKEVADEAPFFEFIQRVCSECESEDGCPTKVKAGCGGFGIRNFLTLFLSIELTKAMREVSEATVAGDKSRIVLAQRKVDCFTDQLNESNPILTQISDAMTEEGVCVEKLKGAEGKGDATAIAFWREKKLAAERKKIEGNERLMECSHRYEELMRKLRKEMND
ncbi:hypothetical protein IV203_036484 [Nitzschia inconspicua]|uniref:4-hydroxyphenylpyruvate dioxygenase n=1 Tax=Nitzschia inconspicua TaxID=303405 RepID=A0A9K3LF96_9STRA|nr:hypothetical protein IV203_036484 [Nitzschia inconspicua]